MITVKLATSHVAYRPKPDQTLVDITIKSATGVGCILAPTWEMVRNSKSKIIPWYEYKRLYQELLDSRYAQEDNSDLFWFLVQPTTVVLACYCQDTSESTQHCHRYLAVDYLIALGKRVGLNVEYVGEA